jgi:hypothetical protein
MTTPRLHTLLLLIAVVTVLSGAVQMVRPEIVLRLVGGPDPPAARHFFGIVGMFMVLFGGLALQALRAPQEQQALPLRWAALQKLGAAMAVGLGVSRGIFGGQAVGVAGFDLATGLLFLLYLRRVAGGPR